MSGPIIQTSPDTERGGIGRTKYAKNIPNQAQEKTNKPGTHLAEEPPTRKLGKHEVVENPPPKVQENVKKKNIECSREAKISYPRQRLEIRLRYAGPPVQTS